MVSYTILSITATAALAFGLAVGFFLAFRMMDRRLQTAREERDRAMDMPNILARRAPVTAAMRADLEKQERKEVAAMQADGDMFGELLQDEVGDEPDDERRASAPAGVDRSLLEG